MTKACLNNSSLPERRQGEKIKIIEMAILRLAVFPAILIIAAFETAWCRSGAGST